jgi:hypothetical protein
VDECGRLNGIGGSLVRHVAPGDTAQLCVDHPDEPLEHSFVPLSPSDKESFVT